MDYISIIKNRYPYLKVSDVADFVNEAKMFYFRYKYPCEPFANEEIHPITNFLDEQWIIRACCELVERMGFNSAVGYRENGVQWTFDGAYLSDRLVSLIKPTVCVPR